MKGLNEKYAIVAENETVLNSDMGFPQFQGKHLIEMGYTPSPKFKEILDFMFQLQIEGSLNKKFTSQH